MKIFHFVPKTIDMDESQNSFYRVRKSYPFKNGIDLLIFRLKEGESLAGNKKGHNKKTHYAVWNNEDSCRLFLSWRMVRIRAPMLVTLNCEL